MRSRFDESVVEHDDGELGLSSGTIRVAAFSMSAQPGGARREYSNLIAASSVGKWPLVRTARVAVWRSSDLDGVRIKMMLPHSDGKGEERDDIPCSCAASSALDAGYLRPQYVASGIRPASLHTSADRPVRRPVDQALSSAAIGLRSSGRYRNPAELRTRWTMPRPHDRRRKHGGADSLRNSFRPSTTAPRMSSGRRGS